MTGIIGETPTPNNTISVCFYCGSFLMVIENLQLRLMTLEEVAALPDEIRNTLVRARKAAKLVKSGHS